MTTSVNTRRTMEANGWRRDERSALVVINEYIKLAYYLVKY